MQSIAISKTILEEYLVKKSSEEIQDQTACSSNAILTGSKKFIFKQLNPDSALHGLIHAYLMKTVALTFLSDFTPFWGFFFLKCIIQCNLY